MYVDFFMPTVKQSTRQSAVQNIAKIFGIELSWDDYNLYNEVDEWSYKVSLEFIF